MRPGLVVMGDVGPKDPLEVSSAEDQRLVQALGPDRSDPPFAEGVGIGGSDRREHDPYAI